MIEIKIEIDQEKNMAKYTITKDDRLEHEVTGIRYYTCDDLFDWLTKSLEQASEEEKSARETRQKQNTAAYAGYFEISKAIEEIKVGEKFTTKDVAKLLYGDKSPKFPQTHANISADFSAFKTADWYPGWLEVVGRRGRSRLYKKVKEVSALEIEKDMKEAAQKAW